MAKRNKYFANYGITTITFTDDDLVDVNKCFDVLKMYLSKRPAHKLKLTDQINKLDKI